LGGFPVLESVPGFRNYFLSFVAADLWLVVASVLTGVFIFLNDAKALLFGVALGSAMVFFGLYALAYDFNTGLLFDLSARELFGKAVTLYNLLAGSLIMVLSWRDRGAVFVPQWAPSTLGNRASPRILVYGVGAIGGLFAGKLVRAGFDVTALARGAWATLLRDKGLVLRDALRGTSEAFRLSIIEELTLRHCAHAGAPAGAGRGGFAGWVARAAGAAAGEVGNVVLILVTRRARCFKRARGGVLRAILPGMTTAPGAARNRGLGGRSRGARPADYCRRIPVHRPALHSASRERPFIRTMRQRPRVSLRWQRRS
jgi:hypothetical protein